MDWVGGTKEKWEVNFPDKKKSFCTTEEDQTEGSKPPTR